MHSLLLGAVSLFSDRSGRRGRIIGQAPSEACTQGVSLDERTRIRPNSTPRKKLIQERLKAVNVFRDTRVNWSGSLRRIAAAMPHSTIITTLSGDAEIEAGSRSDVPRPRKKLVINFETPLAGNEALPQEIDGFLAVVRGDATLKRHFPLVEVTGFRANPARQGVDPSASFSVVCLPGSEKAKKPPGR